jgi:putative membrane protein
MKKQIKKSIASFIWLFLLGFSFTSCNESKKEDPKNIAEDHNDTKFNDTKEKDAKFLVDAASINLEEIQLSQLAQSKAMGTDVKDLAKMMMNDHTKSFDELKALAAKKMITLPTSLTADGEKGYNKLMEKSGNDFDKKYCEMMVDGHKGAIKEFEKASNNALDMDIRDWATKTLPTLRGHLDHAMTCAENNK